MRREIEEHAQHAFEAYARMVEEGVARELARSVLPVAPYTEFYWSCNARALMNFFGLRATRRRSARSGATPRRASSSSRGGCRSRTPRSSRTTAPPPERVERVTGIGGVFLRSADPDALRAWYEAHLGIAVSEWGGNVFAPRPAMTPSGRSSPATPSYWPGEQQVMVNYRVRDLDAMLAQLRAAGAEVDERVEEQEFGRFGWAVDPEGNRFELWQPATSRSRTRPSPCGVTTQPSYFRSPYGTLSATVVTPGWT